MSDIRKPSLDTIAARAGHQIDPATGALTLPIHLSTTFERESDGSFPRGYIYSRSSNPDRVALEQTVAELEGGAVAAAFGSGSAATAAVFQTLSTGDHVVAPRDAYHGTSQMLEQSFSRWGIESSFVDFTRESEVRAAIRPSTKIIWTETPSNPLLKVTDLRAISMIASESAALMVTDNTWATPMLQRPFDQGADLVVHSTTKYLGGHSDVMGGVVVGKENSAQFEEIATIQKQLGAVPSPFDCWLVLRGIRTLPLRIRAHSANAIKVADFLTRQPGVEAVHYPGLASHPGHETASRQMSGFGGMLSFQVSEGEDSAMKVAASVRLFTRATSLGGTESLVEHRASIEGPESNTPRNLLRASVGLENADDLIDDLEQALSDL